LALNCSVAYAHLPQNKLALQTAVLGRNDGLDVRSSLFRAPDGVGIEDCVLGQDYVHALELPMVLEVLED
jgi:hypothetical protein